MTRQSLGRWTIGVIGLTLLLGGVVWLLIIGGSTVSLSASGPQGKPGGNAYEFSWQVGLLLVLLSGLWVGANAARQIAARIEALKGSVLGSLLDAFAASPLASLAWPYLILVWFLVTDLFNVLPSTQIPPVGRVIQLLIEEVQTGRFLTAFGATSLRNGLALLGASLAALLTVLVLGEQRRLRTAVVPWFRSMALIPPLVLFTYAPWLGKFMFAPTIRESFGSDLTVLGRVLGYPDRLLLLATIAFWPLVISGLYRYAALGEEIEDEILSIKLSKWSAAWRVKLPAILLSISPAFHVAIVLIFVVCVEPEGSAATSTEYDGLAGHYLKVATENTARDLLGLALVTLTGTALLFLFISDFATTFTTGQRHSSENE